MRFGREEHQRLYYRTVTSETSSPWIYVLATKPDAEAPVDKIWNAAEGLATIRTLTRTGGYQALIGCHSFGPERTIDPEAAEWLVFVSSQPQHADDRVDAGVVRLADQTLSVKGTKKFHDIQMPMEKARLLEHINGRHHQFEADQLQREGDFWIASDLRSALAETGGTVIAHARTNRILYRATTSGEGAGAVLVP